MFSGQPGFSTWLTVFILYQEQQYSYKPRTKSFIAIWPFLRMAKWQSIVEMQMLSSILNDQITINIGVNRLYKRRTGELAVM